MRSQPTTRTSERGGAMNMAQIRGMRLMQETMDAPGNDDYNDDMGSPDSETWGRDVGRYLTEREVREEHDDREEGHRRASTRCACPVCSKGMKSEMACEDHMKGAHGMSRLDARTALTTRVACGIDCDSECQDDKAACPNA